MKKNQYVEKLQIQKESEMKHWDMIPTNGFVINVIHIQCFVSAKL